MELAKHSFYNHIFPQITKFFAFFKNHEQRLELTTKLYEIINSDKKIRDDALKILEEHGAVILITEGKKKIIKVNPIFLED